MQKKGIETESNVLLQRYCNQFKYKHTENAINCIIDSFNNTEYKTFGIYHIYSSNKVITQQRY